jgi:sugar phosphate isomerase/epimerase
LAEYRIGCHTYLFHQYGYAPDRQLDEIFTIVANAGYAAIELHASILDIDGWYERIQAALERTGLGFVGASNGQPMWDVERHEQILAAMDAYGSKLARFGRVMCGTSCSGKRRAQRTPAEDEQAVRVWTELAEMFHRKGVVLNYHTHGEPIEDIRLVTERVPAELLPLGPDLDWLRVGGIDPEAFLREHASRLVMLHIRDYHLGGERTEALGEGDADYACLGRLLDDIGFTGELVVELAIPAGRQPTRPITELLERSRAHLRETLGA